MEVGEIIPFDVFVAGAPPDRAGRSNAGGRRSITDRLADVADLAATSPADRSWLVRDWIPDRVVTLIYGDGGVGKSLLGLQLGAAVSSGGTWIGLPVERQGPVIFLSAEDELSEVHRRVVAIAEAEGIGLTQMAGLKILPLADREALLATWDRETGRMAPTELFSELRETLGHVRPRLLILDTAADVFGGDENSRSQVRSFVGLLRGLAIDFDLAIVVLAHPSATGIATGAGTSGSTAWSNSCRSRLFLSDATSRDRPDPDCRTLSRLKANFAAKGAEMELRLSRGAFSSNAGSITADGFADAEKEVDQLFVKLLAELIAQGRDASPSKSATYAPHLLEQMPASGGVKSRAFQRAMERLLADGSIVVREEGPPSKRRKRLVPAGSDTSNRPTNP